MKEQIKLLIEERKAQAIKKQITDKAMRILKVYGERIVVDHIEYADEFNEDEDVAKTADNWSIVEMGLFYDYLSKGTNMQIKYDDCTSELTIVYNHDVVYYEVSGEIRAYVPNPEWENKIEGTFKFVKAKEKTEKVEEIEKMKVVAQKNRDSLLEGLRKFWGYQ